MTNRAIKRLLTVLILILLGSLLSACGITEGALQAKNGILTIPKEVTQVNHLYKLKGDWRIVFGSWLDPALPWEEVLSRTQNIKVPGVYKPDELRGFPDSGAGFGTLALKLEAPELEKERYAVETVYLGSAYEMYANGTFIGEVGKIGKTPESTQGHINPIMGTVEAQDGEITLMLHFSVFKNAFYIRDFLIGAESSIRYHYLIRLALDLLIVGSALIMGLYHLCLYWLRRKDTSLLYFAMICFIYCARTLCVGNRFIVTLIPNLDSEVFMRITYITIYLMPMLIMLFLRAIYTTYTPRILVVGMTVFSIATTLMTLVTGFETFDKVMVLFEWVFVILMLSMITIISRARFKGEIGSGVMLSGIVIFCATGVNDLLYEMGIIHTTSLTPIGFMLFLFAQAVMLSIVYSNAYKQAEHLATENLRINEELRRSNEELESAVALRTSQIRETQKALEIRNAELKWQAITDPLTGLYNRRYLFDSAEMSPEGERYGMAVIDIDDFKQINDTYGHVVGDEVICQLAQILMITFAEEDIAARIGGEEFCVFSRILSESEFADKLENLMMRVRKSICMVSSKPIQYTVSIGYAISTGSVDVDSLFLRSDTAVYQAKRSGKNCCTPYTDSREEASSDAG